VSQHKEQLEAEKQQIIDKRVKQKAKAEKRREEERKQKAKEHE
jgi:hypothetical protein